MPRTVPEHLAFRLQNGATAPSLDALAEALAAAPASLAFHHREHYAAWVRHVLGDDRLARRLERLASTRDEATYRVLLLGLLRTWREAAAAL